MSWIGGGISSGSLAGKSQSSKRSCWLLEWISITPSSCILFKILFWTDLQTQGGYTHSLHCFLREIHFVCNHAPNCVISFIFESSWCTLALVRSPKRVGFLSNEQMHVGQGVRSIRVSREKIDFYGSDVWDEPILDTVLADIWKSLPSQRICRILCWHEFRSII